MSATKHFKERVAQRIGPDVCGQKLADEVVRAIAEERDDLVRFACKSKNGPVYRIFLPDRGTFYVAMNEAKDTAITILEPGGALRRKKARRVKILRGVRQ